MKKLNYDRPSLKLLDNFRRELARENSNTVTNSGSEFGQFRTRAEREDALEIHEQRCKSFTPDMQAAISILRERFGKLQKTQNELSSHKSTERQRRFQRGMIIRFHKKNVSECKEALIDAGAIVFSGILFGSEFLDGETWNWLVGFIPLLDKGSADDWKKMLEILTEKSLALAVARQASDAPEGIERFLACMAEADPE